MAQVPDTIDIQVRAAFDWRSIQFLEQAAQIMVGLASRIECMECRRKLRPDGTHIWEDASATGS